jgi:hypothetical protein
MSKEALEKHIQELRKEIEGLKQNMKKLNQDYFSFLPEMNELKLKRHYREPLSDEQNRELDELIKIQDEKNYTSEILEKKTEMLRDMIQNYLSPDEKKIYICIDELIGEFPLKERQGPIKRAEKISPDEATKVIEYDTGKTTIIHSIMEAVVTGKLSAEEVFELISNKNYPINTPMIIDGKEIYPIDTILYNEKIPIRSRNGFQSLLKLLIHHGIKIDKERVEKESPERARKYALEILNSIMPKNIKIAPIPGACSKIKDWDWKSGKSMKKDGLTYDYFYCGEYYFDGEYQLVKFPKDMKLYHGSAILANEAVAYPLGISYYKPNPVKGENQNKVVDLTIAKESPYNVEQLLTEDVTIDAGWFTSAEKSRAYSDSESIPGCEGFCNHAYKLRRDCVFLLLDNEYNLDKILNHPNMTDQVRWAFEDGFGIEEADAYNKRLNPSNVPMKVVNIGPLTRKSTYSEDKTIARWLCDNIIYGNYSGYCVPTQITTSGESFMHQEFIFCNSLLYLERDLSNPEDMFYDPEEYPKNIKTLFDQMKKYETTNSNFHGGNLFEHSIWSLLFSEHLSGRTDPPMPDRLRKLIIASGLIHDIGKMHPESCMLNTTRDKYVYMDIENHPQIGAEYFEKGIPILNDNLEETGRLMPQEILKDVIPDITDDEIDVARNVVLFHLHFGSQILAKFDRRGAVIYNNSVKDYIKLFAKAKDPERSVIATILVSIADIEATQPYTSKKLTSRSTAEIKSLMRSQILPYIISKPKIYRGTDLAEDIKASSSGIQALNDVMAALATR